uniref:Uncharacterized protein n=1 Tax=Sphingobacterium sp. (strain 21) TaxID=743722 RepID=F4CCW3_SPHS2
MQTANFLGDIFRNQQLMLLTGRIISLALISLAHGKNVFNFYQEKFIKKNVPFKAKPTNGKLTEGNPWLLFSW